MRTSVRRPVVAAVAAAALLVPGTPIEASPAPAPGERPGPGSPVSVAVEDGAAAVTGPGMSIEGLFPGVVEPRDPTSYLDALEAYVAEQWDVPTGRLRPQAAAQSEGMSESDEGEASDGPAGTYSFGLPAGDLDGDGLDDAYRFEFDLRASTNLLRGMGGRGGRELWALQLPPVTDGILIPVADLTGDRRADLLVYQFTYDYASTSETVQGCETATDPCRIETRTSFRWDLSLVSGRDGTPAWTRSFPGEDVFRSETEGSDGPTDTSYTEEWDNSASPFLVTVALAGDHDGDGLDDLVLNAVDVEERGQRERTAFPWGTAVTREGAVQMRGSTRAEVVRGTDAVAVFTRAAAAAPAIGLLSPAGDAVGGAEEDLVWVEAQVEDTSYDCPYSACTEDFPVLPQALRIELVDGATLEPVWETTIDTGDSRSVRVKNLLLDNLSVIRRDLTGDGKVDFVLNYIAQSGDGTCCDRRLAVLSGADGTVPWEQRHANPYKFAAVVDPLDGGAAADLLLVSHTFVVEPGPGPGHEPEPLPDSPYRYFWLLSHGVITMHLERVDGATGAELFSTEHVFDESRGVLTFGTQAVGDGDGDGAGDLAVIMNTYDSNDPETKPLSRVTVESAATGAVLYDAEQERVSAVVTAGDLDGDGAADIIHRTSSTAAQGQRRGEEDLGAVAAAVRLRDGGRLWEVGGLSLLSEVRPTGDQSGGRGNDLLLTDHRDEQRRLVARTHALDGASGCLRWVYGGAEAGGPRLDRCPAPLPTTEPEDAPGSPSPSPTVTTSPGPSPTPSARPSPSASPSSSPSPSAAPSSSPSPSAAPAAAPASAPASAPESSASSPPEAAEGRETPPGTASEARGEPRVTRAAGSGRVETAVELSRLAFTDGAERAVLARADDFPDALTAGVLAAEINGPLLLTGSDGLHPLVAAELSRLGVEEVYLAGGGAALSDAVAEDAAGDELAGDGRRVTRLGGADRLETAALVAEEIVRVGGPVQRVVLARADAFPDALAATSLAAAARAPLMLTPSDALASTTAQALRDLLGGTGEVLVAGGPAAVGAPVADRLQADGYAVTRLGGADRWATAAALAESARAHGAGLDQVVLASGADFPDALAAGPAAHVLGGVLLLVDPGDLQDSAATLRFLEEHGAEIDGLLVVGGRHAVADVVAEQAATAVLRGRPAAATPP